MLIVARHADLEAGDRHPRRAVLADDGVPIGAGIGDPGAGRPPERPVRVPVFRDDDAGERAPGDAGDAGGGDHLLIAPDGFVDDATLAEPAVDDGPGRRVRDQPRSQAGFGDAGGPEWIGRGREAVVEEDADGDEATPQRRVVRDGVGLGGGERLVGSGGGERDVVVRPGGDFGRGPLAKRGDERHRVAIEDGDPGAVADVVVGARDGIGQAAERELVDVGHDRGCRRPHEVRIVETRLVDRGEQARPAAGLGGPGAGRDVAGGARKLDHAVSSLHGEGRGEDEHAALEEVERCGVERDIDR
jgi:hypothetical protein